MAKQRRAALSACLAIALSRFTVTGRSDVLIGVNGERFTGKVIAETQDSVTFESELGGRLTVPRARISTLERTSSAEPMRAPTGVTNALPGSLGSPTNSAARIEPVWRPPGVGVDGSDWIQLKSGEWLRGELRYIQDRKVDFESDELKDLSLDLKDVRYVYTAKPLFTKFEGRNQMYGMVLVSNSVVHVVGPEQVSLPRDQLTGITPGGEREIDFWSGKANVGVTLESGNTKQATESASAELARRTPATVFELDYLGNFSEVQGNQNANNHRVNGSYDVRLSRDWFVRPVQVEWYRDQLANIAHRVTPGLGVGYYIFDRPGLEWQVSGGPSYQYTQFETVEPGEAESNSTAAGTFQTRFKAKMTDRLEFIQTFGATVTSQEAGLYTHHAVSTLEFEVKRHLDLNVSFVWDYVQDPKPESSGLVPQHSDYRLIIGAGVKF